MARRLDPGAWRGGWLDWARAQVSPNFDARPQGACIDLIVLHSISLPPGAYGSGAVSALFMNQLDWDAHPWYAQIRGLRVSSHFFITRKGVLWQFVDADQRAWHAGASHWRLRARCNDDAIGIELEGLEGERFEPAQYATLLRLCDALRARYPVRHIAGHEHIAPGRKNDPGPGLDWELISRHCAGSGILLAPVVRR
ncbi:1,6-anhydro-N-acetylmuramyl-L-alanine amidase AmpD [Comamonas sp. NLF-1-9]|uniref:1,6-anhydro-N-acetylmuramyl-L-alanine amidase AmpD n=1 Tax=Comamonas sp. NLF-1-9 TaxID=2853163 RepID=UPI001C441B79|nr:1,6-anhydro-N-acetylmuramyl-L-alanine amidase AmpD [Comamonas sp. NLF-1-9]QXL83373.1 1,6-anhydro-N-acetylmuramyl-L-alanine amidase AmpD [Comamonas sp. NLF-1-9]